jgi:dTDP-N-acetylfucosamine:lipid II N-acetylfucosaminyltransferase
VSQGTILHLFHWDKKFAPPFRDLIHEHFADGRHKFVVYGEVEPDALPASADTVVYRSLLKNFSSLSRAMHRAEKIILHGLFNHHMFYILALQPWLLKKCCWVIWGGDLYFHEAEQKDIHWKRCELARQFVIKRLPLVTTTVPGDYLLVREWYKTKARYIQNLMYSSHICRQVLPCDDEENDILVIQIGNSADPSNNHKEIIDKLSALKANNFVVYAPLSYGNKSYADEVIAYGLGKLGDRFIPLTAFMPFEKYNDYLRRVDMVIFNHMRQQAMGNTIALLSLGKMVWLRSDVTPWSYFNELGLNVYDSKGQLQLCKLPPHKKLANIELCKKVFSERALVSAWRRVFNEPLSG